MDKAEREYQWDRRHNVMVHALANRIYQQERQRIMEFRESAVKVVSLVSGTAAFAVFLSNQEVGRIAGALVAVATMSSLVFGYAAKARDAAKRATEWAMLDRDINAVGPTDFTAQQVNSWAARCNEIEAGEPAPNKRLFQQSYERACIALGGTPTVKSGWLSRHVPAFLIP
ncbi:hypothetical protein ACOTCJ_25800 [Achromobacter xylosoxidans]|uniref:hypothetical protein n=1 Tax=Alcaligenes xylosoxydans xylosoxydans TaxID=85698 RepID=UPI001EEEFFB0|nr:hypothetical protein [Achromobacter xylosoxidans]